MPSKWQNSLLGIIMVGIVVSIAFLDGCALSSPRNITGTLNADKTLLSRARAMTDGEAIELIQDLIKDADHKITIVGNPWQRYAMQENWITAVDNDSISGRCVRHVTTNIQTSDKYRTVSFRVEQNDFILSWDDIEDLYIRSYAPSKVFKYGLYAIVFHLHKESRHGACFDSIDDLNHAREEVLINLTNKILDQNDAIEHEKRLIAAFARLFPKTKRTLLANQAL